MTPSALHAHTTMKTDGRRPGTLVQVQLWPHGTQVALGRAGFHGRWIDWLDRPGV